MSLGAGVDRILQPGQVPEVVPVLRIVSVQWLTASLPAIMSSVGGDD